MFLQPPLSKSIMSLTNRWKTKSQAIRILYNINVNQFQYLLNLLQSLFSPLYRKKALKGYSAPLWVTSALSIEFINRHRKRKTTPFRITWTFPSHQQVVLPAHERKSKLHLCTAAPSAQCDKQPFSYKGSESPRHALEKNQEQKELNFSKVPHGKSWSTTSTMCRWAIHSDRLSSSQL